jgi:thioredoxin-like negative regulator of GroEL
MASLTLVLFRDGRSASADAAAILRDIVRSRAGHHSLTEIDVTDRPELAELYNVRTTPTIWLVKNGAIVDRIVGTPTASLVHNLLETRTLHATGATPSGSRRTDADCQRTTGRQPSEAVVTLGSDTQLMELTGLSAT